MLQGAHPRNQGEKVLLSSMQLRVHSHSQSEIQNNWMHVRKLMWLWEDLQDYLGCVFACGVLRGKSAAHLGSNVGPASSVSKAVSGRRQWTRR